jgi:hypothetical protein
MTSGRDSLWQDMLRIWQRLDETSRNTVLERAKDLLELRRLGHRFPESFPESGKLQ